MTKSEFYERRAFVAENSFEEAQRKGYLPQAATVDKKIETDNKYSYYVVSYSRKDSRFVLPEIYDLQEKGFEIWYDHGIVDRVTHDNDWRKIVHDRISDFHCRGVLFYISENFVLSPSIEEEVRFVQAAKKPHLEIALPMTEAGHERAFYQAGKIAEIECERKDKDVLAEHGLTDKRVKLYKKMFGEEVNYIRHTSPLEERVAGLKGMKEPELFEFRLETLDDLDPNCDESVKKFLGNIEVVSLVAVNYIDITEADIPEVVTINGKEHKVTKIGDCAFANCRKLKSVNIPKTVTEIGNNAFYRCIALDTVELSPELTKLGMGAFKDCIKLKSITIPKGLYSIDSYAFYNCKALKCVRNSANLKCIGANAFKNCELLKEFVFSQDVNIANSAFENSGLCNAEFLGNVSFIGTSAFMDCKIMQVIIPGRIDEIGGYAFARCRDLEVVSLKYCPKTFSIAPVNALFYGCEKLVRFAIGFPTNMTHECGIHSDYLKIENSNAVLEIIDGVEIIGSFPNRPKWEQLNIGIHTGEVRNIILPNSLKTIGQLGMCRCSNLREILIPNNVELIGKRAFAECYRLSRIIFGSSVKEIQKKAFSDCALEDVAFEGDIKSCVYFTDDDPMEHELDITDTDAVIYALKKGYEIRITRD